MYKVFNMHIYIYTKHTHIYTYKHARIWIIYKIFTIFCRISTTPKYIIRMMKNSGLFINY